MIKLLEYTRPALLATSKKQTPERFARRTDSSNDWYLERVGLLELESGSDDLYLYFKVKEYRVSVIILGFREILDKYLNGKFKNDKSKAVEKALIHCLKYNHIKTSCSCPDFKYRFAYTATKKGFTTDDFIEDRPSNVTNPKGKGGLCKHQIKILKIPSLWKKQVVAAIKNHMRWSDKHGSVVHESN